MSGRTTHMPYMAAIRLSAGRNSEGALCHGIFHKQEYGSINPTQLDTKGTVFAFREVHCRTHEMKSKQ